MAIFEGAGVALVTPSKENGEVNHEKLEEIVEERIAGGTDVIIACGTTGEASTMSHEEHLGVVGYVCKVSNKRASVIAGTGSNRTETAVYLSGEAERRGADGLLAVSPYHNKATQKGLTARFTAVADAVKIPVLLYNIPGRTDVNTLPQTIATLCKEVDNIVGMKETSGNFSAITTLMNLSDGRVDLHSGNDDQVVPLLPPGGKGVISVLPNVAPRQTYDICAIYLSGDAKRSVEPQLAAIPLITELFCEANPIPVRVAMNIMGKNVGPMCMPLTEMEPQNRAKLRAAMIAYGIL